MMLKAVMINILLYFNATRTEMRKYMHVGQSHLKLNEWENTNNMTNK